MTGVHQSVGKGCGGWPGLATGIPTLGGLGLVAWAWLPGLAQAQICDRTPAVQNAILGQIADITACEDVTATDLSGITGTLTLEFQSLSSLQEDDFDGLSSLQSLELNDNSLSSLHVDIFDGLSSLQSLELNYNSLSSLHVDIFDGLSSLEVLRLEGNSLSSLHVDIFDGLSNLNRLNLDYNDLSSLHVDIFDGLSNLNGLYLEQNSLSSLDADIFDGLSNLRWLNLHTNDLSSLDAGIFDGLSNLRWLNLHTNDLSSLDAGIFDGLSNLQRLSLHNNSLSSLDADIFDDLSDLQQLDLRGNRLTCLPVNSGDPTLDVTLPNCFMDEDEALGVSVSTATLTVSEGGSRVYTVTLNTQPGGPVTIIPGSSDSGAVSVSPASLTFTMSNWDTPRTVSVTAEQDPDTAAETVTISHSVSGYGTVTSADAVVVSVSDDEALGVSVSTATLTVSEGGSRVYTVTLNTQPGGPVTIIPGSSDSGAVSVSPASLTFTMSNWDTPRTVSVTAEQDPDTANETVTISHGVSGYGTVTSADAVVVSVSDDEAPGVSVSTAMLTVSEGGSRVYTVTLNTQPGGPVTIIPGSSDSGAVSVSPASLTFTMSNWDTPRTVSVTAEQDPDTANETVTISHSVSGYGSVTAPDSVTVTVTDDDTTQTDDDATQTDDDTTQTATAGVNVDPTSLSIDEGGTLTYSVTLVTQPGGNVTITPSSSDSGAVSVEPASLTFTATNWDTPRTVSVTGVEDADTAAETVTISHSVSGYGSVTANSVTVSVTDNDTAGVSVEPTSLRPTEGGTLTYGVTLNTQPAANVTIIPSSSDSGAVSVSPASLTFTMSNWDTPRTVSVTGAEDADTNNETVTISHSVSGYGAVTAADAVTVTVTDDDITQNATAGVSVEPTSLRPTEGGTLTYNVTLVTQPGGPVTIIPSSSDSGAVTVSPASLTFTMSNWDTPRTVSVTGVEDDDANNETVTISHSVSGYGSVTAANSVTVTVTDDDTTQDDNDEARAAKEEAEAVLDEVVLPEVMQQLTARTTEVITSRLNTIASGSLGDPLTLSLEEVLADTIAALHGEREHLKNGSLEWRQAVSGRNFAFPLSGLNLTQGESASAQEHPFSSLAVWGGADYSSYGNTIERTDVDGSGFSGVIGMDLQPTPRLVSGLALTSSRWGLDYETDAPTKGTYEIGITMLHPYLNWLATDQLSLWATFGYGRGAVDHNPEGDAATTRTDGLTSWAGGVRFEVLPGADPLTGEGSPFALAFKVDGAASSFLETQVQLARLAAEVSRSFTVESGLLTTALDLGWSIRSVSGQEDPDDLQRRIADKNDGGGAELAGSLNWRNVDGSVSATVDTRVLLGGGDRREWGMGGQLRFAPSRRAGEGPSLTLQPSFGVTGTRLDELWSLTGDGDPAISNNLPGARLDAQLAYGFRHGNALLTPYTEVVLEETASTYGAGLRYGLNPFLELDLKGAHRSRANGNDENRLFLQVYSPL